MTYYFSKSKKVKTPAEYIVVMVYQFKVNKIMGN